MAFSLDIDPGDGTTLEEFVESVARVEFNGPEDLLRIAEPFAALNANRRLMVDFVNDYLARWNRRDASNQYTGQTFPLYTGARFFICANVWLPSGYAMLPSAAEANQFCYDTAHDHNFSFLTAGYAGPGYRTRIFEYDGIAGPPPIGVPVKTTFLEDTTLETGKLMVYRASRDIHIQYAPEAFSISLNVMTINARELERTQCLFDTACTRVSSYSRGGDVERGYFFNVAALIGDDRTTSLLGDLAEGPAGSMRDCARRALELQTA